MGILEFYKAVRATNLVLVYSDFKALLYSSLLPKVRQPIAFDIPVDPGRVLPGLLHPTERLPSATSLRDICPATLFGLKFDCEAGAGFFSLVSITSARQMTRTAESRRLLTANSSA